MFLGVVLLVSFLLSFCREGSADVMMAVLGRGKSNAMTGSGL